jgi:hypothetical protein
VGKNLRLAPNFDIARELAANFDVADFDVGVNYRLLTDNETIFAHNGTAESPIDPKRV